MKIPLTPPRPYELVPEDVLQDLDTAKLLLYIDEENAKECFAQGCQNPDCPGLKDPKRTVYRGDYERSTKRCAEPVKAYYAKRISGNCSICDTRVTPPSVRFLGRTWRTSIALVLTTPRGVRSVSWLATHLGVPERTVKRWRRWWYTTFVATKFWDFNRADFVPEVEKAHLPTGALVRFKGRNDLSRLVEFLRYLAPLRTGAGA
jgi:hypothetical protein